MAQMMPLGLKNRNDHWSYIKLENIQQPKATIKETTQNGLRDSSNGLVKLAKDGITTTSDASQEVDSLLVDYVIN